MELKELAASLGIENYPEELAEIYENLPEDDGSLYDANKIKALDDEYGMLGEYLEHALAAAADISKKANLLTWLRLAHEYSKDRTTYEARKFPMPKSDGTPATNMFTVLLLLAEYPETVKKYKARGLSDEEIKKNLGNLRINIEIGSLEAGDRVTLGGLYGWLTLYSKALIFDHMGYNYQPYIWSPDAILLKNKNTGEYVFIMVKGKFHKSGQVLGSAGATDEEGSFDAEFEEWTDVFFAHRVKDNRVQRKRETFLKSEWEAVLRPGDDVVALHIPRHTNMTEDYVTESLKEGFNLLKKYYPELSPKCIVCCSWILTPRLGEIIGEEKNLTKFMKRFTMYPILDPTGQCCLSFVWLGETGGVETLSEDTSLKRGIKKFWLNGEHLHAYRGVITDSFDY